MQFMLNSTCKGHSVEVSIKRCLVTSLESLCKDDDGGIWNGKKAIGLDKQNNHFARASRFFVHFSAFGARLQRETAYFHVLSRTGAKDNNFLFLFLNFDAVLSNSTPERLANIWRI